MNTNSDTNAQAGIAAPALPAGRHIRLPGRGRTFIRDLAGPAGAPTVVLLHGWTATADLNWYPAFGPLGEHFRVVALDHRGHGRGIAAGERFRLVDCADDVAALIRVLGLGKVIVVGYSMGGPVAQLLWRRHPSLVSGLVLCATSATFTGTTRERALYAVAAGASLVTATAGPLVNSVSRAVLRTVDGWRRARGSGWWGIEEVRRHDVAAIVEAGRELGRFDSRRWIGRLDVPASVVVNDEDDVVPTQRQRDLAARIPGADVKVVHGGHSVCTSHPERFVPALVAACRTVAAPDPVALAAA